jgi:hypothetical protein
LVVDLFKIQVNALVAFLFEYIVENKVKFSNKNKNHIRINGDQIWTKDNLYFREDKPAVIFNDGTIYSNNPIEPNDIGRWVQFGKNHTADCPAVILPDELKNV